MHLSEDAEARLTCLCLHATDECTVGLVPRLRTTCNDRSFASCRRASLERVGRSDPLRAVRGEHTQAAYVRAIADGANFPIDPGSR
ncbi:hypothetical protein UUA_16703 [Rhodanobacter thiooxydans LCS2]|nr:hypothetical protein UUA_16703 [Rhodanobacter thiooxydans LCS2]